MNVDRQLVIRRLGISLALVCGGALGARDLEFTATGISMPFFDAGGKLTHRLTAQQGAKAGELQNLRTVELVYFSPAEPNVIVQKLIANDAMWDARREILAGRGPIVVATEQNRITGDGFDFALATSLLHVQRDFKMENSELVVTSDRATVELIVQRAGEAVRVSDVKRCEAVGHLEIVVQPTAKKRYEFVRAFSELATYDGSTQKIELPQPIRYRRKDGSEAHSNRLTIDLAPKPPAKK